MEGAGGKTLNRRKRKERLEGNREREGGGRKYWKVKEATIREKKTNETEIEKSKKYKSWNHKRKQRGERKER